MQKPIYSNVIRFSSTQSDSSSTEYTLSAIDQNANVHIWTVLHTDASTDDTAADYGVMPGSTLRLMKRTTLTTVQKRYEVIY